MHRWQVVEGIRRCKRCGIVKRRDGTKRAAFNGACRGSVARAIRVGRDVLAAYDLATREFLPPGL